MRFVRSKENDKYIYGIYQEYYELGSVFSKEFLQIVNDSIAKTSKQLEVGEEKIRAAIKRHQALLLKNGADNRSQRIRKRLEGIG